MGILWREDIPSFCSGDVKAAENGRILSLDTSQAESTIGTQSKTSLLSV